VIFIFVFIILTAFVVPRRYFGFYVAWLAMPAMVGAIWPTGTDHSSPFAGTGTDHSSPFAGTGDAIYALICIVVGLGLAVRAGIIAFWPQPSQGPASPTAWTLTGAIAAACAIAIMSLGWSELRPVWMAYIPALVIVGASLALLLACRWLTNVRLHALALGLAVSSVASFTAATIWMAGRIDAVVRDAERIAGDKPYCIQVATTLPFGYLARSKLAFSPPTMRTKCIQGWCFENHAILAVDDGDARKLMNWSHRRGEFRDEALNLKTKPPLAVMCQPQPHFARELPWLFP
jgi:hypothetical protein